jgi:hypothetical protein
VSHPGAAASRTKVIDVVDLVRTAHLDDGLVAVSLRATRPRDQVQLTAPGRVRVVDPEVADRLQRLLDAAVTHARGAGRPTELDLDRLVERAAADVAGRRRT